MPDLPPGVTRDPNAPPGITLDNCSILQFELGPLKTINVSRDGPRIVRPLGRKRYRDVRPGDTVLLHGRREVVTAVTIYR